MQLKCLNLCSTERERYMKDYTSPTHRETTRCQFVHYTNIYYNNWAYIALFCCTHNTASAVGLACELAS